MISNASVIDKFLKSSANKNADYPDHPDDIVISKGENIAGLSQEISEANVYDYYTGAKNELLKELKNRNLFIVVKPKGVLRPGQKPIYIRHPYHGNTEYIRISNPKDFEEYHSGRTVEYHVTMPQMAPYYIVDFDAPGKFSQTTKITADIADALEKLAEVRKVEIRYTGKRGFHIIGWLKKPKDVNDARNFLKDWLKETFGDRDDVVMGESPKGNKGALGLSPMKLNGGHVAKYSMRVSGLCCIEVPRSKLLSFKREDASIDKTYKKITGHSFSFKSTTKKAETVVSHYLKQDAVSVGLVKSAGYIRGQLKPGYKGKFVIHDHYAERAGRHFDLRLEFPVTSLQKSLGKYTHKRPGTKEPVKTYPDKPGTVYRSFAEKKHAIPTAETKYFVVETEDHPIEYGSFHGVIPEGYGAGKVKIFDKGTYEILEVEGDKKYVLDFHGSKIKGSFALIKYNQGYLWVKSRTKKEASAIDYVQATLSPQIFDIEDTNPPQMREVIRTTAITTLVDAFEDKGLDRPFRWIKGLYLSGSTAGFNYKDDADFDVDVLYDPDEVRKIYPELSKFEDDAIFEYLKNTIYKKNNKSVAGTSHTFSYMVLKPGDGPSGDGIYDIIENKWIKVPTKIPEDFDPDKAFMKQKMVAEKVEQTIDLISAKIIRIVDDLKIVDQYEKNHGGVSEKRVILIKELRDFCTALNSWYDWIWSLQADAKNSTSPIYPAFDFSANWDERMIIFKYLARNGYQQCVANLYKQLKGDPYLEIIDQFIPS